MDDKVFDKKDVIFANHFGSKPSRLIENQMREPASIKENNTDRIPAIAAPEIIRAIHFKPT
ncbi:hypothetical protein GCM10020331_056850 [Ectobacillus funiculus]